MSIQDFIEKKKFSRRSFLKGLAALGSASLLGGCGNKLSDAVGGGPFGENPDAQLAHFALRRDRCGLFIDNLSARYESVLFDSLASYLFCGDAFHRVLYTLG